MILPLRRYEGWPVRSAYRHAGGVPLWDKWKVGARAGSNAVAAFAEAYAELKQPSHKALMLGEDIYEDPEQILVRSVRL